MTRKDIKGEGELRSASSWVEGSGLVLTQDDWQKMRGAFILAFGSLEQPVQPSGPPLVGVQPPPKPGPPPFNHRVANIIDTIVITSVINSSDLLLELLQKHGLTLDEAVAILNWIILMLPPNLPT